MDQLSYRRHRFPPPIIQHAIWLYLRFPELPGGGGATGRAPTITSETKLLCHCRSALAIRGRDHRVVVRQVPARAIQIDGQPVSGCNRRSICPFPPQSRQITAVAVIDRRIDTADVRSTTASAGGLPRPATA